MNRVVDERRGGPDLDELPRVGRLVLRYLCSGIPDDRVEARVDVFRVVLVHDLSLDDAVVLGLLGKLRREEEQLA